MDEKQFFALHHKQIWMLDHPYCGKNGTVLGHRLDVEKAIGRYLTPKEVIHHHYNKDGSAILVLCPDKRYHMLLHTREEALRRCGNANWRRCTYCKEYDSPENMSNSRGEIYHKKCATEYHRNRRAIRAVSAL